MIQQDIMKRLVDEVKDLVKSKQLRTYSLYKSPIWYGYGIVIHSELIPFIMPEQKLVYPYITVDKGSPSFKAGMRNNQRIVAVDGEFVNENNLKCIEDVMLAIEDSHIFKDKTDITIIEPELWNELMTNPHVPINSDYQFKRKCCSIS